MELRGCRILITGGSGCIGTELLNMLQCEKLADITVIGRKEWNQADVGNAFRYVRGDICDKVFMEEHIKNADILIHLAAKVHAVPQNMREEEDFFRINTKASEDIFELSLKYNLKKVIFTSTVAVFGDNKDKTVSEETLCNPITPYGRSKFLAEEYLLKLNKEYGLPMSILRPVAVFGNRDIGNMSKLLKLLKKGIGVVVAGGRNQKSFVYGKDVAASIIECIKNDKTNGKIYIISAFNVGIRELIKTAQKVFNINVCTISIPLFIINIAKRLNKKIYSRLKVLGGTTLYDGSKFICETGFKPKYDLESGLTDSYHYYADI